MALAILHWKAAESGHYRFKIDIGTNMFYKFNIGRNTDTRGGVAWVTDVIHATPFKMKKSSFFFGDTSEEVLLPKNYFGESVISERTQRPLTENAAHDSFIANKRTVYTNDHNCYIQLISAKDEHGKSLAVSDIVKIPFAVRDINTADFGISSIASMPMNHLAFSPSRNISQNYQALSHQYSLEEIIGNVARVILPAAVNMLTQATENTSNANTAMGNTANSAQSTNIAGLLSSLLRALLPSSPNVSTQQSTFHQSDMTSNRFSSANSPFSNQMVFGIDDALLATMAGPIIQQGLQLLPQLINASQQHRLQVQQANNQLMSGLAGEVQRRLMMQQLLQNQTQGQPATQTIDPAVLAQLLAQLQQAQPTAAAPPTAPIAPAIVSAHSLSNAVAYTLSNNVLLTFESLEMQKYIGKGTLVLQKSDKIIFRVKINTPTTPKSPLPKAIYTFSFKDTITQKIYLVKTFKKKDIIANTISEFDFSKNELINVPLQNALDIFVEMRWQTKDQQEFKAVNSCNAVFVENYFLESQGTAVSQEKELNDMKLYRSFWNKIWQSPVTGKSKFSWELQIDLKYTISLSPDHPSNGLTDTKLSVEPKDKESLIDTTAGKMKAGLELSLSEINKLMDGWDGEKLLDEEKLSALKNLDFTRMNAAELIHNITLKGKSYEQGAIWIIPIFKLFELTVCKIENVNEYGYVKDITPVKIKFPLPVSARILGLKSNNN